MSPDWEEILKLFKESEVLRPIRVLIPFSKFACPNQIGSVCRESMHPP